MKRFTSPFIKWLVATILVACGMSYYFARKAGPHPTVTEESYIFNDPADANASWIGPPIGEEIDLKRLKDNAGTSLSNSITDRLSMLVLIDPECGACKAASDEMRIVRDAVTNAGVQYYLVSVTSSVPPADFFRYAESLNLDARAYLWAMNEGSPSEQLYSMVLPSHILVDGTGRIVRKWAGTAKSQSVRYRMANQITSETLSEISSLKR
jgi:hypothetical protein